MSCSRPLMTKPKKGKEKVRSWCANSKKNSRKVTRYASSYVYVLHREIEKERERERAREKEMRKLLEQKLFKSGEAIKLRQ